MTVSTDVEPIDVPSAAASAIALIVNELLTNAVKHAFADGRGGTLAVTAKAKGGRARIDVCDDGPGMPADASSAPGLGITLINRLSRQVKARTTWRYGANGNCATLEFPILDPVS